MSIFVGSGADATIDLTADTPVKRARVSRPPGEQLGYHYETKPRDFALEDDGEEGSRAWRWDFPQFRWVEDELTGVNRQLPDGSYARDLRSGHFARALDDAVRVQQRRPGRSPRSLRLRRGVGEPLNLDVHAGDLFWNWRTPPEGGPGIWARMRLVRREGASSWAAAPQAGGPEVSLILIADGSARFTEVEPAESWFLMHAE